MREAEKLTMCYCVHYLLRGERTFIIRQDPEILLLDRIADGQLGTRDVCSGLWSLLD